MSVKITIFIFLLGIFAFLGYLFLYPLYLDMSNQLVTVEQQQDVLYIQSPFYVKTISLAEITNVKLYEELPKGKRIFGTDAVVYAKGRYTFDGIGECDIYIASNHKPYIYVEMHDEHIIFNDEDAQHTRQLYRHMQKEVEGRRHP